MWPPSPVSSFFKVVLTESCRRHTSECRSSGSLSNVGPRLFRAVIWWCVGHRSVRHHLCQWTQQGLEDICPRCSICTSPRLRWSDIYSSSCAASGRYTCLCFGDSILLFCNVSYLLMLFLSQGYRQGFPCSYSVWCPRLVRRASHSQY
jgi:hypothetical protein